MSTELGEKYRNMVRNESEDDDENGDDDDGSGAPPESEPEAGAVSSAQPMGELDAQAIEKAIRKARDTYIRALGRIDNLGAEHWHDCETCGGIGLVPPDFTPPPELLPAPDKALCEACNGYGVQSTPSLNPNNTTAQCPTCSGNGWKLVPIEAPPNPYVQTAYSPSGTYPANGGTAPAAGIPGMPADAWGRPAGHPHYGLDPARVGV